MMERLSHLSPLGRLRARPAIWGLASIAVAWAGFLAGMGRHPVLFALAGAMILLATVFIAQWMFGPGTRSVRALGLGGNREAVRYAMSLQGVDPASWVVALLSLISAAALWEKETAEAPLAAFALAAATFYAVIAAMRLNREWPVDRIVQSD
ncbi:MAG: hypothetical protein WC729_05695 [Sphingomonas sp.]|jgi:hypothetical protein|uniref:hypothetical protein n=1 Tax=Sphingomonas sp. TaxID=28214 RepID=UPI0035614C6D